MKNKRNYFLGLLIFVLAFFTFGVRVYAIPDPDQPEVFLYGFGDDYEDDEFLTLYNVRTCYVALNNIPISSYRYNEVRAVPLSQVRPHAKFVTYSCLLQFIRVR